MEEKLGFIFRITSPDGVTFVGSSTEHPDKLPTMIKRGKISNRAIVTSIKKLGIDAHTIEILRRDIPKSQIPAEKIKWRIKTDPVHHGIAQITLERCVGKIEDMDVESFMEIPLNKEIYDTRCDVAWVQKNGEWVQKRSLKNVKSPSTREWSYAWRENLQERMETFDSYNQILDKPASRMTDDEILDDLYSDIEDPSMWDF